MDVLNAAASSEYFDSAKDEREDSAVRVIHWAWLEHSSTLGRLEHLEPTSPLDMFVLYQAATATFKNWTRGASPREELAQGDRVIRPDQAWRRLQSVADAELAALAPRFANRVIAFSANSASDQDLNYCVDLFLHALQDKRVIDAILNGSISSESKQLTDINPTFRTSPCYFFGIWFMV